MENKRVIVWMPWLIIRQECEFMVLFFAVSSSQRHSSTEQQWNSRRDLYLLIEWHNWLQLFGHDWVTSWKEGRTHSQTDVFVLYQIWEQTSCQRNICHKYLASNSVSSSFFIMETSRVFCVHQHKELNMLPIDLKWISSEHFNNYKSTEEGLKGILCFVVSLWTKTVTTLTSTSFHNRGCKLCLFAAHTERDPQNELT